jgi:hypothetical protein
MTQPRRANRPRPSIRTRAGARRAGSGNDLKRLTGSRAAPRSRSLKPTGKLRRRRRRPLTPVQRAEHAKRTKRQEALLDELVDGLPEELTGGANRGELKRRLRDMLRTIEIENYTSSRLARSRGLRYQHFGKAFEVFVRAHPAFKQLRELATADLQWMNNVLKQDGGKGLVNGRGDPLDKLARRPGKFSGPVEIATDIRLVAPGGDTSDPRAGLEYVDGAHVSFTGQGSARFVAGVGFDEIKVPKKQGQLGPQTAKATPRLREAGYLTMRIEDGSGRVLRREVIPVENVVINPSSTASYGHTSGAPGRTGLEPKAGRGRTGLAQLHFRHVIAMSTKGPKSVIKTMYSRAALSSVKN